MSKIKGQKSNFIRGAIWTVGTRILIKSLGFVNTLVMARLLMPSDYGLVALAMLVVGVIQVFLDFGATIFLLRKDEVSQSEIDSAWTLRLLQSLAAGVIIFVAAPLAAKYFNQNLLIDLLWTFGACVILAGGSNIGVTLALKKFNFSLDFKIQTTAKLASVGVTIVSGIYLRDYRALTLGIVANYMVPLILSYILHPYRPRWDTSKIAEIWHITKWLMFSQIGDFLLRKSDELYAGRIGTTAEYGLYYVGSDLGQLPIVEIGPAMQRAILPVLASMKDDVDRIRQAVLKTLSAVNTVIWPIGFGCAALSRELTEVVLGDKWTAAGPYVAVFALMAILQTFCGPLRPLFVLHGHTKVQSSATWIEFSSFVVLAILLVPSRYLMGLAYARLMASAVTAIYFTVLSKRVNELSYTSIFLSSYRPILISVAMYFMVIAIVTFISSVIMKLVIGGLLGALFYIILIFVTWHFSNRPEGLESTLVDAIYKRRH